MVLRCLLTSLLFLTVKLSVMVLFVRVNLHKFLQSRLTSLPLAILMNGAYIIGVRDHEHDSKTKEELG
jgi:hypothetical protein